jgi:hypothetical protein
MEQKFSKRTCCWIFQPQRQKPDSPRAHSQTFIFTTHLRGPFSNSGSISGHNGLMVDSIIARIHQNREGGMCRRFNLTQIRRICGRWAKMKSHHKTHIAKRPRRGQIAWKLLYIRVCVRLMGWIMPPHSMHVCFIFCVRRWRAAGRIVCCAMRNNGFLMKMCVRVCTPYQNLLLSISLRKATISWGLLLTGNWIFPRLSGALNWKYAKLMLVLPQRLYLVAIFRFQKSECAKEQVNFNRQRLIWCYFWQQITNFVDQCKILENVFFNYKLHLQI